MKIIPHKNGPLQVNDLSKVKTSGGEINVEAEVYFCRCGGSANKPYCDGTHKKIGYSSERETKRELYKEHHFEGKEITIHDNRTICSHSGICISQLKTVFSRTNRPWINADGDSLESITNLIHQCPSGSLSYSIGKKRETDFHDEIFEIKKNGPYQVRGKAKIELDPDLQPPNHDRFSICRCGQSKNKPYCDGNHLTVNFRAE